MSTGAADEVAAESLHESPDESPDEASGVPGGAGDGTGGTRRRGVGWLVAYFAGLTALCGWVFWPSIRTGFFEDDFGYLNVTLPSGWWHSTFYWDLAAQTLRPVTVIAIGIQREVFGFHPLKFHLVALGLLTVQGVLVFLLARKLGLARTGALAASTVLMLHTTNGWVLAWTASTSSTYAVIFGCAVIWFLAGDEVDRRSLVASSLLLVVALLSREICMVLPAIAFVVRYYRGEGEWWPRARRSLRETAPLWGILLVYLAVRVSFSAYASSKPEVPRLVPILNLTSFRDTLPDVPVHARDLMTLASGPFHSTLDLSGFGFSATILAVAAVFWVVVIALVVREARAGRWIAVVGLAWFFIGILPPLFLQPGITYGNYTDLALPGLALALGAVAQSLAPLLPRALRPVAAVVAIAVLAVLARNGGNALIRPVPPLITRAIQLEAQARRDYPDPPRGSTIVIRNAIPQDILWSSNGDLFRAMYDDPDLKVEFRPGPAG